MTPESEGYGLGSMVTHRHTTGLEDRSRWIDWQLPSCVIDIRHHHSFIFFIVNKHITLGGDIMQHHRTCMLQDVTTQIHNFTVSSLMICNGSLQISPKFLNLLFYNFAGAIVTKKPIKFTQKSYDRLLMACHEWIVIRLVFTLRWSQRVITDIFWSQS